MAKILVFSEFQNNKLKRSSQELLQFAAKSGAVAVVGFSLGSQAGASATEMAHHGATEILISKECHPA